MWRHSVLLCSVLALSGSASARFRVYPYLQNPGPTGMTVLWLSEGPGPGRLRVEGREIQAEGHQRSALGYSAWETEKFFPEGAPAAPYQHEARITGLKPGQRYAYEVEQDGEVFRGQFQTAPERDQPIRFIAFSDSETEPESTGAHVVWSDPQKPGDESRRYLIDQTDGYAANLRVVRERRPNFLVMPGDLVENGGEQRDWDEFWKQNTNRDAALSTAASIPLVAVVGNHDYYGGPGHGGFKGPASENAVAKYLTYFRPPSNGAEPDQQGRYYRLDYGPVTVIAIDSCNGQPQGSEHDSNHHLDAGSRAPDFNPGSAQYAWLEAQLKDAQRRSHFTFVCFHHVPYSSGLHCVPPGFNKPVQDPQSGQPLRVLTPLFLKYGVDALLCGHDEMMERSEVRGEEQLPNGTRRPRVLQVWDVGVAGDGLRGPVPEAPNPWGRFLAHRDAPEVWRDGVLVDGGKHYGHLEVDVQPEADGWVARCSFAYIFPVMNKEGKVLRFERRLYSDEVVIDE